MACSLKTIKTSRYFKIYTSRFLGLYSKTFRSGFLFRTFRSSHYTHVKRVTSLGVNNTSVSYLSKQHNTFRGLCFWNLNDWLTSNPGPSLKLDHNTFLLYNFVFQCMHTYLRNFACYNSLELNCNWFLQGVVIPV